MSERHHAIGIKQTLRLEWMQKAADLLLTELDAGTIRRELHDHLKAEVHPAGPRSDGTRTFAVNNLMNIWVGPPSELLSLRDTALVLLREQPSTGLIAHWAMISAVYPFWFNVARQTGRLLSLQDRVTQTQIVNRLKEHYGDRQTVSRYARFVIRSFVAWKALEDSAGRGCYQPSAPLVIADPDSLILLFEAALHATPDGKSSLAALLNNPGFFPFRLPTPSGDGIAQRTNRIEVIRNGLHDELLRLNHNR